MVCNVVGVLGPFFGRPHVRCDAIRISGCFFIVRDTVVHRLILSHRGLACGGREGGRSGDVASRPGAGAWHLVFALACTALEKRTRALIFGSRRFFLGDGQTGMDLLEGVATHTDEQPHGIGMVPIDKDVQTHTTTEAVPPTHARPKSENEPFPPTSHYAAHDDVRTAAPSGGSPMEHKPFVQIVIVCAAIVLVSIFVIWFLWPRTPRAPLRAPPPSFAPSEHIHGTPAEGGRGVLRGEYAASWSEQRSFRHPTVHLWTSFRPGDDHTGRVDLTMRGSASMDCVDVPYTVDARGHVVIGGRCDGDASPLYLTYDATLDAVTATGALQNGDEFRVRLVSSRST